MFGKRENVLSWQRFLEQEKVPFRYKGEDLGDFSLINILVGFCQDKIKRIRKSKGKIFIELKTVAPTKQELINAFNSVGLPYIHFWYYPILCPSIFLFRIDVDYVDSKGLERLFEITKRFKIKGTYFINISGDEEFDDDIDFKPLKIPTTPKRKEILQKLLNKGNELANHGYRHRVYDDFGNNYRDIRRCRYYLKRLFGIKDKGFVPPGGKWNRAVAKAINKNNFLYCSHIISKTGELPFYTFYDGEKMGTLEMPFYEMSDGKFESVLKWCQNLKSIQKVSQKLKKDYLRYVEKQLKNNKPIAIMAHPHLLGKIAEDVLPPLFKKISQLRIPNYTLKEFAEWWRRREKFELKYCKQDDKIIIYSNQPAFVEIIFKKNKKILWVDNKITVDLKSLK